MAVRAKSVEWVKNLLIAILVPLVVSTVSIASRYGAQDQMISDMVKQQEVIVQELKSANTNITTLAANSTSMQTAMNGLNNKLMDQQKLLNTMNREIGETKSDSSRIDRLEDVVYK